MQIHELNTLGYTPGGTDYLAIDTGFDTAKISAPDLLKPIKEQADQKINLPRDEHNQPDNGTAGQLLRTNGDGTTEWVDEGLPTDEQTEEAINKWLDDHPEATTTVADGSLTEAKFTDGLKDKTIKDYVTPQMFGAVADANYYNAGAWYKDAGFTEPATDNTTAFQDAIDSGYPVGVPVGSYYLANEIMITASGTTLFGFDSEETGSKLNFHDTNGIVVASDTRFVTIENICLVSDTYTRAGIEVSYQASSNDGSVHYLTIQKVFLVNFKYGLCIAGYSATGSADNQTYLWDCSFKDIKINTLDAGGDNCAVKIFQGLSTHFGILFERVTCVGYTIDVNIAATTAIFTACNFGINSVNAIDCQTVCDVLFEQCNFECDSKVTGALYDALIYTTFRTTFISCNFYPMTDSNVSFIGGGLSSSFVFISNKLKLKTGDEMTDFFSLNIPSAKGSIVFGGGNTNIPRPTPYKNRSLQTLDLERSILPLRNDTITIDSTDRVGEMQFDVIDKTGGRPLWYNGANWKGAPGGEWIYLDAVAPNESKTLTFSKYTDRPRTSLITVRGNHQDCYSVGLLFKYRDADVAEYVSLTSKKCNVAVSGDTVTITSTSSSTEYMYASLIDLI